MKKKTLKLFNDFLITFVNIQYHTPNIKTLSIRVGF